MVVCVGLVLTAVAGLLDYVTGYEISVSILYLGPISLVAWYGGRVPGAIMAIVGSAAWSITNVGAGEMSRHPLTPYWNGLVLLGEFLIVVFVVDRLKIAYNAQVALVEELREATTKIKTLRGLVPICAWCKKIRDDEGYWRDLEAYMAAHSEAVFTHGICPQCEEKVRKEFSISRKRNPGKADRHSAP